MSGVGLEVREGCLARAGLGAETWMATSGDYVPPAGKAQATSAPPRALSVPSASSCTWPAGRGRNGPSPAHISVTSAPTRAL